MQHFQEIQIEHEVRRRYGRCVQCGMPMKAIWGDDCVACFEDDLRELGVEFDPRALRPAPMLKKHNWGDQAPVRLRDIDKKN